MLSLPWTLRKTSAVVGVLALIGVGILNHTTLLITARCCVLSKKYTYKEMGQQALGARLGNVIQAVMLCYTLGTRLLVEPCCAGVVCVHGCQRLEHLSCRYRLLHQLHRAHR